jgi:hypothetical protein
VRVVDVRDLTSRANAQGFRRCQRRCTLGEREATLSLWWGQCGGVSNYGGEARVGELAATIHGKVAAAAAATASRRRTFTAVATFSPPFANVVS